MTSDLGIVCIFICCYFLLFAFLKFMHVMAIGFTSVQPMSSSLVHTVSSTALITV